MPTPPPSREGERLDEVGLFWEQAGELFCVLDADGRFLRVNPAWTRTLGWKADELLGRRAADLLAGGDACATESAELQPNGELVIHDVDNRYRHQDGSIRWLRWNGYQRDGLWFGTARDITASRTMDLALRISERRARSMLEAMNDGLVILDARGRIVEVNGVFSKLVGLGVRDIVGLTAPYPWWPDDQRDTMSGLLREFLSGETNTAETVVQHADGRRIPVIVNIARLSGDRHGEDSLLVAVRDISELVALRDRLVEANRMARLASWEWYAAGDRLVVFGDGIRPDMPPVYEITGDESLAFVVDPEQREQLRRLRTEIVSGERESFTIHLRVTGFGGAPTWAESHGAPIRNPDGVIVGVRGTMQQVSGAPPAAR